MPLTEKSCIPAAPATAYRPESPTTNPVAAVPAPTASTRYLVLRSG